MRDSDTNESAIEETMVDTENHGRDFDGPGLARGEQIGRYMILERVGAGGMGVVYAAYDPELDRKIALKRMHADRSRPDSLSDGRSRLVREAQSMARLSHPNVVAVHDVGVHEGRVFLAMEFVEGQTLHAFLKQGPHPWRDVLRIFCDAGRGLAAAHDVGLVHRDFKPENVLLRENGVAKVTDFGLAREGSHGTGSHLSVSATFREESESLGAGVVEVTGPSLTRTGAVLGTPAYMAPEQHAGLPCEPRTDQFSFCVALYEALYGERPFEGSGRAALAIAVAEGVVSPAPAGTKVPGWLRDVVLRGLQPDPAARHPSMADLIAALETNPAARRRPWIAVAGLGAAALTIGLGVAGIAGEETTVCTDAEDHLVGVWDGAARDRLKEAFESSGVGFAESTFERTSAGLDAYTAAWVAMRTEACEATQIKGEQSQALMDLRMECLDGRLGELQSLVEILSKADATGTQNAVAATSNLPGLDRCADAAALRAAVPPPDAETIARVSDIRTSLSQVRAHGAAGQYEAGLELAQQTVESARASGYDPILAEALLRRGTLEHQTGSHEAAEQSLEEAYFLSVRNDMDDTAARSATQLVDLVGKTQVKSAQGRRWAAHASAQADASGQALLRAAAMHALAGVAHAESAYAEAKELAIGAREIRTTELGARHEVQLASANLLGMIELDTGNYELASEHMKGGLELGREILGPDHPDLARFLNNLAKIAWRQGKAEEAGSAFAEALELQENALGSDHPNVAQLQNNLAAVAVSRGDMDEAARRFELALAIWERSLGSDHPSVADGLNNLAVVSSARGRYEESREYDQRALEDPQRTMEPGHPSIAQNYNNLGEDLMHLGELEGALELHEKALRLWEAKLGPKHDDVAVALTAVGNDLVLLGRPAEALPKLERARKVREPLEIDEVERAHTTWTLARALWDAPAGAGRDRDRARRLAKDALAAYEAGDETSEAPKVRAWLTAHGGG